MSRKSSKKIAPSPAAQSSEQIDPSGMSVHATAAQISDAVRIESGKAITLTTWIHIWRKHVVWFLHFEFGMVLRVNFDRAKICTHEYRNHIWINVDS